MKRKKLQVTGPGEVSLSEEEIGDPKGNQLLVESALSAISSGTEKKFLSGHFTRGGGNFTLEDPIGQRSEYPFELGYSSVGKVLDAPGRGELRDRWVFAYAPHSSHFIVDSEDVVILPEGSDPLRYVFFANMETAFSLIMDGNPMIGEEVLVLGQGVVGLLLVKVLSTITRLRIVTVDRSPFRRQKSRLMGATESIDPEDLDGRTNSQRGFDLVFEVTGNMNALTDAVRQSGYSARVVIGSYYGDSAGSPVLGEGFHRKRLRLLTSQVSTVDPSLSGRWDDQRRRGVVKDLLELIDPEDLVTHRFTIGEAEKAYSMIGSGRKDYLQILFDYQKEE